MQTRVKRAGELPPPPAQAEFDQVQLPTETIDGYFWRIHRNEYHPVYYSKQGLSRFDHKAGVGVLCLGPSLRVCMQEVWGDFWSAEFRLLDRRDLRSHRVSLIAVPRITVARLYGHHLSLLGLDGSISTTGYELTREWTLRVMQHPANVDGMIVVGRHDNTAKNLVLFGRPHLTRFRNRRSLRPPTSSDQAPVDLISVGRPRVIARHPEFRTAVADLALHLV